MCLSLSIYLVVNPDLYLSPFLYVCICHSWCAFVSLPLDVYLSLLMCISLSPGVFFDFLSRWIFVSTHMYLSVSSDVYLPIFSCICLSRSRCAFISLQMLICLTLQMSNIWSFSRCQICSCLSLHICLFSLDNKSLSRFAFCLSLQMCIWLC